LLVESHGILRVWLEVAFGVDEVGSPLVLWESQLLLSDSLKVCSAGLGQLRRHGLVEPQGARRVCQLSACCLVGVLEVVDGLVGFPVQLWVAQLPLQSRCGLLAVGLCIRTISYNRWPAAELVTCGTPPASAILCAFSALGSFTRCRTCSWSTNWLSILINILIWRFQMLFFIGP